MGPLAVILAGAGVASTSPDSRGLADDPIATDGPVLSLDGAWELSSAPTRAAPPPPLPSCASPCCFQNDTDWRPQGGGDSGRPTTMGSAEECCAACRAAGDSGWSTGCYVAVFFEGKCWMKTRADAAGGSYTRTGAGRVSCMPMTRARPPPPPPPPPVAISGTVPGDLISDLEAAGLIGDPLFENNFLNASLWDAQPDTGTNVWSYSKTFTLAASPGGAAPTTSWVVFEGIKMGAAVYIDGTPVGNATDQFKRYTFPIPAGDGGRTHTVRVVFDPSIDVHGRFMGCTGGWDWVRPSPRPY